MIGQATTKEGGETQQEQKETRGEERLDGFPCLFLAHDQARPTDCSFISNSWRFPAGSAAVCTC